MPNNYKQCYPFMDKFELCAKIDPKTEYQQVLICNKGEKDEKKCIIIIDCNHTSVCNVSPSYYKEYPIESSEGKMINLDLEDKWMVFKNYVQGISESGFDAMDLVNNLPEISEGERYRLGSSIAQFVFKNDPNYAKKNPSYSLK